MYTNYEQEIHQREAKRAEHDTMANFIGIFKLIWVVISCYTLYIGWSNQFTLRIISLLFAEVLVYVLACIYHWKKREQVAYETGLIKIANENLRRISGEWISFPDIGEDYINYEHSYATDLDIVGKHSLFQLLNSTHTYYGRLRFSSDLLAPNYSSKDIQSRQEAIAELSAHYSWTSHIEYCFSKIGLDHSFPRLVEELQSKQRFIHSKLIILLLDISRFLTCFTTFLAFLTKNNLCYSLASIFVLFQLLLWGIGALKANGYIGIMQKIPYKLDKYNEVIHEIVKSSFSSEKLKEIKSTLTSAERAMKDLGKISSNIRQRNNGIACILLNGLWLWDYKNAVDLDNWKQQHADSVAEWLSVLGELESLLSFSNLPRNCSLTCIPTLYEEMNRLTTISIGHPLLNNTDRIYNDLEINNHILIISGSNMSGKTTFMRTVGINMVLANSGSYVCAEQMSFSSMKILTSMRIADALTEGISTFYAELKRIKQIITTAQADRQCMFLIDEIFRGTNSVDRLIGAKGVLKKLYSIGICGMITTHDLEVCKLENTYPRIHNFCFYEQYRDDEIHFDYKMKKGISKTTNAKYLLKKVGIIDDFILNSKEE